MRKAGALRVGDDAKEALAEILEHTRGELEEIGVDNPDYDESLANIGKGNQDA